MNTENGDESRFNTRETGNIKLEKIFEGIAGLRREMADMKSELKSEIVAVRHEMADVKNELKSEIVAVRHEMADVKNEMAAVKAEVAGLKGELKSEIVAVKSEMTVLRSDSKSQMAGFGTQVNKNFETFYWRAFQLVSLTLHNTY
jgi:predicted  nucleic acid-binding Zn-ribbon protein